MAIAIGTKGNRKRRKVDQPKRQRYNAEKRGFRRRLRTLEKHIENSPNDKVAEVSLSRVRKNIFG